MLETFNSKELIEESKKKVAECENKFKQYDNICLAIMANLQGFYNQDEDLYLGRINLKDDKDKFLLQEAVYCSYLNKDKKVHLAVLPLTFLKIKKQYKNTNFIRDSYYSANADYDTCKMEDMLLFVQKAYGYSKEKDDFNIFRRIYKEYFYMPDFIRRKSRLFQLRKELKEKS